MVDHDPAHTLTKDWIKRTFKLDPIPQVVVFHTTAFLVRGRGAKVVVPNFIAQFLVRTKIVHKLDIEVAYYRAKKGKQKSKRTSPKKDEPEEEPTQALPQEGVENV